MEASAARRYNQARSFETCERATDKGENCDKNDITWINENTTIRESPYYSLLREPDEL